ncbi:MAG: hypothetical protein Q9169_006844 [Polycauliona sp. 2 TL-2023]
MSSGSALNDPSSLTIEAYGKEYRLKVEVLDILTWAWKHAKVPSDVSVVNVARCWSQAIGKPGAWLHNLDAPTANAVMDALWRDRKYEAYRTRWEDQSTNTHRELAKDGYERLMKHILDTITMADMWLGESDEDIAITLTYLYGKDNFDEKFIPTSDIDDPKEDMTGKQVGLLGEYHKTFFLGEDQWNFWDKYQPNLAPDAEKLRDKNGRTLMDERLMQMPWMAKFVKKDEKKYKEKTDTDNYGGTGGYKFFKVWTHTAKEWDAQRPRISPEAS